MFVQTWHFLTYVFDMLVQTRSHQSNRTHQHDAPTGSTTSRSTSKSPRLLSTRRHIRFGLAGIASQAPVGRNANSCERIVELWYRSLRAPGSVEHVLLTRSRRRLGVGFFVGSLSIGTAADSMSVPASSRLHSPTTRSRSSSSSRLQSRGHLPMPPPSSEDVFGELTTGILEEQHVKILEARALKNAVRIKTMEPPGKYTKYLAEQSNNG